VSPSRRRPSAGRRRSSGLRLSGGAWLFVLATLLIGLVAIDTDANLLLILFGICVGALLLSAAAAWLGVRGLEVARIVPDGVMAGQACDIRYQITSRRRWLRLHSLRLGDEVIGPGGPAPIEVFVPCLPAGRTATVSVTRACPRRGRLAFEAIHLSTAFPFGLLRRSATVIIPQSTVIYPSLGTVRERRWQARRWTEAAADGRALARRGDDEFYGLREYRAGDNPRRIHWRRSARAGQLIVREMAQLGTHQIWCVLDSRIPAGDAELDGRLEEAISCVATVACDAIESNVNVGLICGGEPPLVLPPGGGRDYRLRVLRELALRPANHDVRLLDCLRRIKWPTRWRGTCLVFAGRANDDLADVCRMLAGAVGAVTTYVPGAPAFDAIYSSRGPRRWIAPRDDSMDRGEFALLGAPT